MVAMVVIVVVMMMLVMVVTMVVMVIRRRVLILLQELIRIHVGSVEHDGVAVHVVVQSGTVDQVRYAIVQSHGSRRTGQHGQLKTVRILFRILHTVFECPWSTCFSIEQVAKRKSVHCSHACMSLGMTQKRWSILGRVFVRVEIENIRQETAHWSRTESET